MQVNECRPFVLKRKKGGRLESADVKSRKGKREREKYGKCGIYWDARNTCLRLCPVVTLFGAGATHRRGHRKSLDADHFHSQFDRLDCFSFNGVLVQQTV